MDFTALPGWATRPVTFPVRSLDGQRVHYVRVTGDEVACDSSCEGFRFRGACRHVAAVRAWLGAVIPPRAVPG